MSHCVRCYVTGHVQGVWFRRSTQLQALRLGLTGYAKNRQDGSVEVVVCGVESEVKQLLEWLWQGPVGARVENVSCAPLEGYSYSGFTTL